MFKATDYRVAVLTPSLEHGPRLQSVPLVGLAAAEGNASEFALEPLLPLGVVSLLGGHGGTGKSVLALIWAAHVACGRPWGPFDVRRAGRVLIVSLEDTVDLVRARLRAVAETYRLPVGELEHNLSLLDGSTEVIPLMTSPHSRGRSLSATEALRQVREASAGHRLIIVDNSSLALQADANAPELVYQFIATLAGIARASQAALLCLNHVDKAAARDGAKGNTYAGTAAWHNATRSRMGLTALPDLAAVELTHEKANLTARVAPVTLVFNDRGILEPTSRVELQAARAADAASAGRDDDALVYRILSEAILQGQTVPAAASGTDTVQAFLASLPGLPAELRLKSVQRRLREAVQRLEAAGRIQRAPYASKGRNTRYRFVLPAGKEQHAACVTPSPITPPK